MSGSHDAPPEDGPPKKPPRPLWQQIAYNMMPLVLLAMAAAFVIPFVQEMMNPEPRRLVPLRGVPQPPAVARPGAPIATEPPASRPPEPRADPAVVRAYGEGAANQAAREAQRFAGIAVQATRCNMRDAAWTAMLREAIGPEIARRHNSYDGKPEDPLRLQGFVTAQFAAAVAAGATGAVRYECADLPSVPEFRAADSLVQRWRAARQQ
jgi:hypothetical protein